MVCPKETNFLLSSAISHRYSGSSDLSHEPTSRAAARKKCGQTVLPTDVPAAPQLVAGTTRDFCVSGIFFCILKNMEVGGQEKSLPLAYRWKDIG